MSLNYYCTLFDSNYLLRGVSMLQSLAEKDPSAKVFVFPFDKDCESSLRKLNLSFVQIVSLAEFETEDLLAVKKERSKGEYCWTCTPWIIRHCIEKFSLDHCTYIDADLYFYSNPQILLDEAVNSSVLITEHRYTPEYDQSATSGIYCVQFVFFRNDSDGLKVLHWWADRCLEWCYARIEDGKFGDQKYLDNWTTQFSGVHVLQHLGGGVAPWNVQQYELVSCNNEEIVLEHRATGKSFPLVFYHFHDVKSVDHVLSYFSQYYLISDTVYSSIYERYSDRLNSILKNIESIGVYSEKALPIINDFAKNLNYLKSIKNGDVTDTIIYISNEKNNTNQKLYKFNFASSKFLMNFNINVEFDGLSSNHDHLFLITIVPMIGSSNEIVLERVFAKGLGLKNQPELLELKQNKLKRLLKGNWQKRKGTSFIFYSNHGFFSFPIPMNKIFSISIEGKWRTIDPVEAAKEISKLSFSKRFLKKIGF